MKKMLAALLCALLSTISLTGCGNSIALLSSNEPPSTTAPEPTETQISAEPDFSAAHTAYLQILRNNKKIITAYNWQQGTGPVALADFLGDATPELVYITMPAGYTAYLNIWSCKDGEAVQIMSAVDVDAQAGGGVRHCLFTTTNGDLYLYKSVSGEPWIYSFTEYELNSEGTLIATKEVSCKKTPSPDYTTITRTYMQDNTEITASQYDELTGAIVDSMSSVLMWSGTESEQPIWSKTVKVDNLATSYADAIAYLESKVSSTRTADNPFTEEEAIAFMVPVILEEWGDYISEKDIPDQTSYKITVSDKLFDGQPIYLINYSLYRIGSGAALVFADGSTITEYESEFSNYNGYFIIDITANPY